MATKAFQKIYTKISQITKATCSLKATEVRYDELAMVNGKLAQVDKIAGDEVTLQVFEGTEGIPTNAEVVFLGKSPTLKVSEQLAGRFGDVQIVLKELVDGCDGLLVEIIRGLAAEDLLNEHLAQRDRKLIAQTAYSKRAVSNNVLLR